MTTEGIAAVLARLQDGYVHLDAAGLATHYAEDCVVESPVAGVCIGRLAVERGFRTIFSAFPDLTTHTDELLTFGDRNWTAPAIDPMLIRAMAPAVPAAAPAPKPADAKEVPLPGGAKPTTTKPTIRKPEIKKPGGGELR